jgi:hypothetical protein
MTLKSYFGACDRRSGDASKEIVNTIPLWQNEKNTRDLKEEIRNMDRKEKEEPMTGKVRARFMARKKKLQDRYEAIMESDPRGKMDGIDKDRAKRALDSFKTKIRDIIPSKSDMHTPNKVKPAFLSRVAKTPCVKLDSQDEIEEARLSNLKVKNGMITKDDLVRAFNNIKKSLGEEIAVEDLRRPGFTPAGREGFVGYDPVISEKHEEIFGEKPLNNMEEAVAKKPVKAEVKWVCDRPDCREEMSTRQKGMHIARHRREDKKKAREEQLVTQEA